MDNFNFEHLSGCLLGGAVGDALGAPVEFQSIHAIRDRLGPQGVQDYPELNRSGLAEFTDDTQMTLFSAEGLIVAHESGELSPTPAIHRAYLRWLRTQEGGPAAHPGEEGWLLGMPPLWKIKAPGNTCLSALGSRRAGSVDDAINNSKGCGGVMRAAPLGFLYRGEDAFRCGAESAALTHGHPSGYLSAGFFAQLIAEVLSGQPLEAAVQSAAAVLASWPGHAETLSAVQQATALAQDPSLPRGPETVQRMGGAWVGEEALAISLYCALAHPTDFAAGVLLAVNHSGDSDSTGALAGNLLGAMLGASAIPAHWLEKIEMRSEIERISHLFAEIEN